ASSTGKSLVLIGPDDPQWPQTLAFFEKHAALMDAIREGAARPALGLEMSVRGESFSSRDRLALYGPDQQEPLTPSGSDNYADRLAEESMVAAVLLPELSLMRK